MVRFNVKKFYLGLISLVTAVACRRSLQIVYSDVAEVVIVVIFVAVYLHAAGVAVW